MSNPDQRVYLRMFEYELRDEPINADDAHCRIAMYCISLQQIFCVAKICTRMRTLATILSFSKCCICHGNVTSCQEHTLRARRTSTASATQESSFSHFMNKNQRHAFVMVVDGLSEHNMLYFAVLQSVLGDVVF